MLRTHDLVVRAFETFFFLIGSYSLISFLVECPATCSCSSIFFPSMGWGARVECFKVLMLLSESFSPSSPTCWIGMVFTWSCSGITLEVASVTSFGFCSVLRTDDLVVLAFETFFFFFSCFTYFCWFPLQLISQRASVLHRYTAAKSHQTWLTKLDPSSSSISDGGVLRNKALLILQEGPITSNLNTQRISQSMRSRSGGQEISPSVPPLEHLWVTVSAASSQHRL